jgi:TRAP-type C4-dicarboxylate transport system permease small subunit
MDQQSQNEKASPFETVVLWISRVMAVVAAVVLALMMMIIVIDVCGRYFFLAPLEGSFELVGILMVIAGSWGMGYCQLQKGNIRINVLSDFFPPMMQSIMYIIAYLIGIVATGMICWRTSLRVHEYFLKQLGGVTDTLSLPIWFFLLMLAMGVGWVCFIFIIDLYKTIVEVVKR